MARATVHHACCGAAPSGCTLAPVDVWQSSAQPHLCALLRTPRCAYPRLRTQAHGGAPRRAPALELDLEDLPSSTPDPGPIFPRAACRHASAGGGARARAGARSSGQRLLPALLRRPNLVVLALDTAQSTGWALYDKGSYVCSGECDPWIGAVDVVERAWSQAQFCPARLAVVAERPWGRLRAVEGLSVCWGGWRAHLLCRGVAPGHLLRVWPATWQSALFPSRGLQVRGAAKACALQLAQRLTGRAELGADEADAICLGRWAADAAERLVAPSPQKGKRRGTDSPGNLNL